AALLWQLFRALIEGALEGLVRDLGRKVIKKVLAAIDQTVEGFQRGPANRPGTSGRAIEGRRVRLPVTLSRSQLAPKCQLYVMTFDFNEGDYCYLPDFIVFYGGGGGRRI
ncbi:MAG: hypothetical protein ACLQVX_24615, partial [Limisphaerales bacterium]